MQSNPTRTPSDTAFQATFNIVKLIGNGVVQRIRKAAPQREDFYASEGSSIEQLSLVDGTLWLMIRTDDRQAWMRCPSLNSSNKKPASKPKALTKASTHP